MTRQALFENILKKKSFLCVGLDTDITKIPRHLSKYDDPVFEFNKQIIDATKDLCVAYKPNIAFYESLGAKGWESLEKTLTYIPNDIFTIADAKRGDIGNSSQLYAKTFFDPEYAGLNFDAVTVAPYMGHDSVMPFLKYQDKWVILLALTSNEGALDFQTSPLTPLPSKTRGKQESRLLYEEVLIKSSQWGSAENMMYVIGATRAEMFKKVREIVPDHFLLVPGIGSQGGKLSEVARFGMNKHCGLIVNASRSIIYAGDGQDFAGKARQEAQKIQGQMEALINKMF